MPRLIEQHLRLVLQRRKLVIDLLQRIGRRHQVLAVVRWIEHSDLRQGRGNQNEREGDGSNGRNRAYMRHVDGSVTRVGRRSAAQAASLRRSQAAAKPSRPGSATSSARETAQLFEQAA